MIPPALRERFYPGGEPDGARLLYGWIRRHVGPGSRVLNLGAGPPTGNPVQVLKGEVARVVGADIDPVVLANPELDEAVVTNGVTLPFPDNHFDAAFSDYVFEHVEHPVPFLREACRVLRPGGSLFFRTPNLWHYVALISWATPHGFHRRVANWARRLPEGAHEPWPTRYRMNTSSTLRRLAGRAGYSSVELRFIEGEPMYFRFHVLPWLAGVAVERVLNLSPGLSPLRVNILGRLVK